MENQVAMRILGKNASIPCLFKMSQEAKQKALLRVRAREVKGELDFLKMDLHVGSVLRLIGFVELLARETTGRPPYPPFY